MNIQALLLTILCIIAPAGAMERSKKQTPLLKDMAKQSRRYSDDGLVKVQLQGAEQPLSIPVKRAKLSTTLNALLEDAHLDAPIPLPGITPTIWALIQGLLEPVHCIDSQLENAEEARTAIVNALEAFDVPTLFAFLEAVNYLDIPILIKIAYQNACNANMLAIPQDKLLDLPANMRNRIIFENLLNQIGPLKCQQIALCEDYNRGSTGTKCPIVVAGDKIIACEHKNNLRVLDIHTCSPIALCSGHTRIITAVRVVGNIIISASEDGTIRMWDINTGIQLAQCNGHTASVEQICVSGDTIISSSDDLTIRTWHLATGQQIAQWPAHTDYIDFLEVAGDTIISASHDLTICLWNATRGNLIARYRRAIEDEHLCLAGNKLVFAAEDNRVRVLDIATGRPIAQCIGHTSPITDLLVHNDKIIASSRTDNTALIWDLETGNHTAVCVGEEIDFHFICAADTILISQDDENGTTIHLWDLATGRQIAQCIGHTAEIMPVCATKDKIVSISFDMTLRVWDMSLINRLLSMNKEQARAVWLALLTQAQSNHDAPSAQAPVLWDIPEATRKACWLEVEALLNETD